MYGLKSSSHSSSCAFNAFCTEIACHHPSPKCWPWPENEYDYGEWAQTHGLGSKLLVSWNDISCTAIQSMYRVICLFWWIHVQHRICSWLVIHLCYNLSCLDWWPTLFEILSSFCNLMSDLMENSNKSVNRKSRLQIRTKSNLKVLNSSKKKLI